MILSIPFLILVLIGYNIAVFAGDINSILASEVVSMNLVSGATWSLSGSDLFIIFGIIILYLEIIKATRTGLSSILDHTLSTLVFIAFLIEFLMVKGCGTSTFFVLMLMALLDVVSGFTVSIVSARRDFGFGGNQ